MDLAFISPEEIALPPSPPEFADAITNVHQETEGASILQPRPETPRQSTEPPSLDDAGTRTLNFTTSSLPSRPRNHSPYSRTHYRSRSFASSSTGMAPPMARAHSSPGMDSSGRMLIPNNIRRPSSPLGPPQGRRRSPLRSAMEEPYPTYNYASGGLNISQPIAEYSELDITPRASVIPEDSEAPPSPLLLPAFNNTFPRSRRRPSSPLHQVASAPSFATPTNTTSPISSHSSPLIGPSTKFNEPYPSSNTFPYSYSFGSSSMPSTPTSMRSRSPSISSLETIPDDTDAEEAALAFEAERIAALKAAAEEGEEAVKDEPRRRTSLDVPGRPGNSKRKRWSVCGAERRGDLDLETIWED
jgi:hypothetical protein